MQMLGPNDQLRSVRMSKKLSRAKLASSLGVSHSSIARWELGEAQPTAVVLERLCSLFDCPAEELGFPAVTEVQVSPIVEQHTILDPLIPLSPPIGLVGRDTVLAQIKTRLCSGATVSLTSLNGLPGVGKTTLAAAVARDREIQAHFVDGVLWAGLGPTPNLPGILSRWATLLGLSAAEMATLGSIEEWTKALRTAIGSRSMLLVIDDAWTLEDALTFRIGGANCTHFVTTRFPPIATHLTADGAVMLQELNAQESMSLLRLLAPGTVNEQDQRGQQLVEAVGGLPLALTLIGNYLRAQVYRGPTRRLHAALQQLTDAAVRMRLSEPHPTENSFPSLSADMPLSLQSVIAVTDQLLTEQVRAVFYALAILPAKPNSFAEQTALAVTGCSTDDLDTLSDAGLLECSGLDRYALHQVLADYARLHLENEAKLAAFDRLIEYVIGYVTAHVKDYELLETESSTILTALDAAYEYQRYPQLIEAVCLFSPFLILRGFYTLAEQHLKRAHEAALQLQDERGLTGTWLYQGEIARKQGDLARAESYFQQGLQLARKLRQDERVCDLLTNLGSLQRRRGEFAQAETSLLEALTIARQNQDHEHMCSILKLLGTVAGSQGQLGQAEQYMQEGLELARLVDNRAQMCSLLGNLGAVAGELGKHDVAKEYFQRALALARQIGHRELMCVLSVNLGNLSNFDSDYLQADAHFEEGLEIARQIHHQEWISVLLAELAYTRQMQGLHEQAATLFQESLQFARQIGQPRILCNTLYLYGGLFLEQGQTAFANECFQEMLQHVSEGDHKMFALAYYGLGRVAAASGDIAKARRLGEESLKTLEDTGYVKALEVKSWLEGLH